MERSGRGLRSATATRLDVAEPPPPPPRSAKARRKRVKKPDSAIIENLSSVVASTEAQFKELSAQHEKLRAQHDALCGAVACLEGLIYATRPLRRAARRAAAAGAAAAAAEDADHPQQRVQEAAQESSDEEDWGDLRELCRQLRRLPDPKLVDRGGAGGWAPAGGSRRGAGGPSDGSAGGGAGSSMHCSSSSSSSGGGGGDSEGSSAISSAAAAGSGGGSARVSGSPPARHPAAPAAASGRAHGGSTERGSPSSGIGPPPRWARYIGNDDPDGAFGPGGPSGGPGAGDAPGGPNRGGGGGPPCPVALLARLRAMTAAEAGRRVQRYVHVCSIDLLRVRAAAGDGDRGAAAVAEARLAEQLDRLMAFSGALLAANPRLLGEVSMLRLDFLRPYGEADAPERDHWRFALRQAGLTRRQELSMACLMELYKSRLAALLPRREELLAHQSSRAHDAAAQSEVLALLEQLQLEYSYTALAFANALYSCVLKPHQAAAIWAGAFPYIPQLVVLDQALCSLQAEAATNQPSPPPATR